jgi:hypothetical protein
MPKPWIELKEARGKKVKRMTVEFDPDYNCVTVEFTDDDRLQQVYFADGDLFSALTTAVRSTKGQSQSGIAWFALTPVADACAVTATVEQQGYIAVQNASLLSPAVAVNQHGAGVISFGLTGPNSFPSSAYVQLSKHSAKTAVHLAAAGFAPEDGFSGYLFYGGNGIARWGDYSGATVGSDGDLWFATEYITRRPRTFLANWGTFIGTVPGH